VTLALPAASGYRRIGAFFFVSPFGGAFVAGSPAGSFGSAALRAVCSACGSSCSVNLVK
jgi:hypothetical protein